MHRRVKLVTIAFAWGCWAAAAVLRTWWLVPIGLFKVMEAVLFALSGIWVMKAWPSQKETKPVGVPVPGGVAVTVAVMVTALFEAEPELLNVVVVALA